LLKELPLIVIYEKDLNMKINSILVLTVIASMSVACGKSDDTDKEMPAEKGMIEKAKDTAAEMKDNAGDMINKSKEVISDTAKTGSSAVVEATEDAKEIVTEKVDTAKEVVKEKVEAVKESAQEKAADLMGKAPSTESVTGSEQVATKSGPDLEIGKSIYANKCSVCHASGAAGAPKLDDGSWATRKAQGMGVMVGHAIKGFQGAKGYMPAKGGFMSLSDEEVAAAVAYMAAEGK
jgi:cytochrome c5